MEINKEEFYKQKEKAKKEIDEMYEKAEKMQRQFDIQYKDDICEVCNTWTTSIIVYPYGFRSDETRLMTKRLCKKCFVELMSLRERKEKEYEREHNKLLEKLNRKYKKIDMFLEE